MDRFGYAKKLSTGIVATVGTLGVLIPPSVVLILLGIITQQSIGGSFLPYHSRSNARCVFRRCYSWMGSDKSGNRPCMREIFLEGTDDFSPCRYLAHIDLSGCYRRLMYGFFTPTEAGSVGTFAVLLLCVIKKGH